MAKDYARKIKHPTLKPRKKATPFFSIIIVALVVLGLILIIYKAEKLRHERSAEKKIQATNKVRNNKPKRLNAQIPEFDFYTILPKEKVWVPKSAETPIQAPKEPTAPIAYILQVASFKNLQDADTLKAKLLLKGYPAHIKTSSDKNWHEVWLGPYESLAKVQSVQVSVSESNHLSGLIIQISE